ncbi:MAG TPA: rhodanese-like domain-containing protein [Polyangiales bacterium]|nr:rhodanese-like domain-containing protein [Polyangiales bacterium]
MNTISRDQLLTQIRDDAHLILLEALPEQYWRKGHLPGARLFPHDRVRELAAVAAPRKTDPIVVYCASDTCKNSHQAAEALEELGYANVRVYVEGKADWQAAGLPLER